MPGCTGWTATNLDRNVLRQGGVERPGGFPFMAGAELVAAIAVSGAPNGQADEVCTKAAITKTQARVK